MKLTFILLLLISYCNSGFAQTILIRDVEKKPVAKASVTIQVKFVETNYVFHDIQEKLFTVVTDTTGKVTFSGEFQKVNHEVKSIDIVIAHQEYETFKLTTTDYSPNKDFTYYIYLTPKTLSKEVGFISSTEAATKLKLSEKALVALIESGELKAKKIGSVYFISLAELKRYIDE